MRPTRWPTVLGLVLVAGVVGWLLADQAYSALSILPVLAPILAAFLAVFELALARVVSRKIRRVGHAKPMHPLQIARAAVLGKASSATGALLLGFYGGFFVWVSRRTEVRAAAHDAWVSGLSAAASALLLVAGLLLERSCRTPVPPD